jgi:Tfp pilus assembly protein PilV
MRARQCGFSLIEAMVSVLVLTVGLLGLAQLQARLWHSAGELHSDAEARLLAVSELEKALDPALPSAAAVPAARTWTSPRGTRYRIQLGVSPRTGRVDADVAVRWRQPGAGRAVRLHTAAPVDPYRRDTRWLLPLF